MCEMFVKLLCFVGKQTIANDPDMSLLIYCSHANLIKQPNRWLSPDNKK